MALQTKTFTWGDLAYGSESNSYQVKLTLTENSISDSLNSSNISYKLEAIAGSQNQFYLSALGYSISLNNDIVSKVDYQAYENQKTLSYNTTITIAEGVVDVGHNTDGTLTMPVSFSIDMGDSKLEIPDFTYTDEMELTSIAVASGEASVPTLSLNSVDFGETITISTNRQNDSFTHSLHYTLDGGVNWGNIAYGVESSYEWTVPVELANEIPEENSMQFRIMCRTYDGDTIVGDRWTDFFSLRVPDWAMPTATVSCELLYSTNYGSVVWPQDICPQGYCKARLRVDAKGTCGAGISYIEWLNDNHPETLNPNDINKSEVLTNTLNFLGDSFWSVEVVDTRGNVIYFAAGSITILPFDEDVYIPYVKNDNGWEALIPYVGKEICLPIIESTNSRYTVDEYGILSVDGNPFVVVDEILQL